MVDYRHTHTHRRNIMSTGNKSGFEIRADLLQQAEGLLMTNHQRQIDAITYNNEYSETKTPVPVFTVTAADVIATARELYEFVNDKQ